MISHRVRVIVAKVIEMADRAHPADSVLRAQLKRERGLSREMSRAAAENVFAYYRWKGWVNPSDSIDSQITHALELARRFSQDPSSFTDRELLERAVPGWLADHVEISPKWVRSLQMEPMLWLRARVGLGPNLSQRLGDCRPAGSGVRSDALQYQGNKDLFTTLEFQSGEFELQDLSSQAVGWICAPAAGETWWDACAGEGGKTLHLADLMSNKGLIWATDRAAWRLKILRRRAARAKVFNYRAVLWPQLEKLPTRTKFDGVLLDAPCSGVGTWQRNPQARWTTTAQDVVELSALQRRLLAQVAKAVKPGGKLIYSVCTLTRAETIDVAAFFDREFPDFQPSPVASPFEAEMSPRAQHWLWPQDAGGNGMFVAVWRGA